MTLFFIEIGKYINIVLAGIYCILAYISLGRKDEDGRNGIFHVLEFITILLFLSGVTDLALAHSYAGDDVAMRNVILLGIAEAAGLFAFARLMYHFYPEMNRLLLADMEFMLCIGFVVLMRLNYRHALRQYIIIAAGLAKIPVVGEAIRDPYREFDPEKPDAEDAVSIPPSGTFNNKKPAGS